MVSTTRVMLSVAVFLVVITVSMDTVSAKVDPPAWKDIKGSLVQTATSAENMKSVILITNWLLGLAIEAANFLRGFYHSQIQSEEQLKAMFKTIIGPPLKAIVGLAMEMGA